MLYNCDPRTFDLTDVTGVMNICDRHMGAIAMRVFCNLFVCPVSYVYVHPDWLTRDCRCDCALTPSTVRAHRLCSIVPTDYARLNKSGNLQGVNDHST